MLPFLHVSHVQSSTSYEAVSNPSKASMSGRSVFIYYSSYEEFMSYFDKTLAMEEISRPRLPLFQ